MENMETLNGFFPSWEILPRDFRESLTEIIANPDEMEMLDQVMVAPCPNCGSTNTRDCENTSLADPTICVCMDCGCIGCLTCGAVFNDGETQCPHWSICENCSEPKNARGYCSTSLWECPTIKKWKANRQYPFEF
ncbi:MAG: hypothetical protein R6U62_04550 [Bacteroidales bacterium]